MTHLRVHLTVPRSDLLNLRILPSDLVSRAKPIQNAILRNLLKGQLKQRKHLNCEDRLENATKIQNLGTEIDIRMQYLVVETLHQL